MGGHKEPRDDKMAAIVKETKSLETAILRAYHEVDSAKEYDQNIKQKFRRYFDRLGPLLREDTIDTRDVLEKCGKLQKLSDELTAAANDQAQGLSLLSSQLKAELEKVRSVQRRHCTRRGIWMKRQRDIHCARRQRQCSKV